MLFLWQTDYLAVTQPAHHLRWWHLPQLHRPTAVRCNREHLRKQLLISATVILQPSVFQQCLFHQSTEAEHTHMNPGSDHGLDFWVWKQPNVTDLTTPQHNPSYTECQDKMHWDAKSYLASDGRMTKRVVQLYVALPFSVKCREIKLQEISFSDRFTLYQLICCRAVCLRLVVYLLFVFSVSFNLSHQTIQRLQILNWQKSVRFISH